MKFARLEGAHIFNAGTWNGLSFTEADLDAIVNSFTTLALAGRVPLKFGHNPEQPVTDGQPALGWVEKVYRKGGELLADFRDIPEAVFESIKKGLYKFVSIELMRPQSGEGEGSPPFVLDAVALLGADKPAVGNLRDLQALAMSRRGNVLTGERVTFTVADPATIIRESKRIMDVEELQRQLDAANARIAAQEAAEKKRLAGEHRAKVVAVFERGVKASVITPAQRDTFTTMLGINDDERVITVSVEDAEKLIGPVKEPKAPTNKRTSFSRAPEGDDQMEDEGEKTPDAVVADRIETYIRENRLDAKNVEHYKEARRAVFAKDRALASSYVLMHDAN